MLPRHVKNKNGIVALGGLVMTTLTVPSLGRRLLQTVKEEVEAKSVREWPQESVELSLILLRQFRERTAGMRRELEEVLARGVEARSFARERVPALAAAEDRAAFLREFIEKLGSPDDPASAGLLRELQSLEEEEKAYYGLLSEALARVSAPVPAMDWDHLKRKADADFAAGRYVRFTTAEEMIEALAGPD
jgi:hypothetical protein